jgi:hypothetical protein
MKILKSLLFIRNRLFFVYRNEGKLELDFKDFEDVRLDGMVYTSAHPDLIITDTKFNIEVTNGTIFLHQTDYENWLINYFDCGDYRCYYHGDTSVFALHVQLINNKTELEKLDDEINNWEPINMKMEKMDFDEFFREMDEGCKLMETAEEDLMHNIINFEEIAKHNINDVPDVNIIGTECNNENDVGTECENICNVEKNECANVDQDSIECED